MKLVRLRAAAMLLAATPLSFVPATAGWSQSVGSAGADPATKAPAPTQLPRSGLTRAFADLGRLVGPNAVDTAEFMMLGGARQWVTVRGQDRHQPIILFLHGGPGGALTDYAYAFQRPWEDYFTVVQWDQRGFGRSAVDGARLKGTITKDRLVADSIELIEELRNRLGQRRIILVGQSWGTILGLEVAKRRPDMLVALVAIGQQTAYEPSFERTRELLIDLGRRQNDTALVAKMTALGPPPRASDVKSFLTWVNGVQGEMTKRGYSWHNYQGPGTSWGDRLAAIGQLSPTITDAELAARMAPSPDYMTNLGEVLASVSGWDAVRDVGTQLNVPYFVIAGSYDWQTPIDRARTYYNRVKAPTKRFYEFPNSAHAVLLEEPGRLLVTLVNDVRPLALKKR